MTLGETTGTTPPVYTTIDVLEVESELVELDPPLLTLVFEADVDEDGLPDDLNGDGLPDVIWPRVLFQKLDPEDESGLALAEGGPMLPGVIVPLDPADPGNPETNLVLQAAGLGLPFDGVSSMLVEDLTAVIPALALEFTDGTTATLSPLEPYGDTARGTYQVLVMNNTGQLWTIPNELAGADVDGQQQRLLVR